MADIKPVSMTPLRRSGTTNISWLTWLGVKEGEWATCLKSETTAGRVPWYDRIIIALLVAITAYTVGP